MKHYLVTGPEGLAPCGKASPGADLSSDNENLMPCAYRDPLVALMVQPAIEMVSEPTLWEVEMSAPRRLDPFRDVAPSCRVVGAFEAEAPSDLQCFAFAALLTLNYVDNHVVVGWLLRFLSGEDRTAREADAVYEKLRLMTMMDTGCSPYLASAHAMAQGAACGDLAGGAARSALRMAHDAPPGLDLSVFASYAASSAPESVAEMARASVRPCTAWKLSPS